MRCKDRIPIIIKKIKWNKFFKELGIFNNKGQYPNVNHYSEQIEGYWKQHPDLRLTQVLVNLGIVPNKPGFWYYKEDNEIPGVEPEETLSWTSYGKTGRAKPTTRLLKDLDKDHIEAILRTQNISDVYKKIFKKLLKQK